MTYKQIVLDAIHHQPPARVPYSLAFEPEIEARLDEHFGAADWRERIEPFILHVGAVDTDLKEPIDAIRQRDGYGGIWRSDRLPWHLEQPPLSQPSFAGYQFPEPQVFLRPDWKEQAFQTCEQHRDSFLVGDLGWGLFERAWNLRGFETLLVDVIEHPAFVAEALDRIRDLYLAFVEYTADLPVDGILFGDDWGDQRGVILGPNRWRELLKPRWAEIYAAVHRHGKLVMHHSCGSVVDILPDCIQIGMDVLESVQPEARGMRPYDLKAAFGGQITLWGGLGSQSTLPFGTPQEVKTEVRRLRELGASGGYILAPAKPLREETPLENALAVLEAFTGTP